MFISALLVPMVKSVCDLSYQYSTRSSKAPCEKKSSTSSQQLSLDDGPRSCLLVMSSKDAKLIVCMTPRATMLSTVLKMFTLKASLLVFVSVTMFILQLFSQTMSLHVFTHLKTP